MIGKGALNSPCVIVSRKEWVLSQHVSAVEGNDYVSAIFKIYKAKVLVESKYAPIEYGGDVFQILAFYSY